MTNVAHSPEAGNVWNRRRLQWDLAVHLGGGVPVLALALAWGGAPAPALGAASLVYAASAAAALRGLDRHAPHVRLGPANRVTLFRSLLMAILAGALPGAPEMGPAVQWLLAGLAFLALLLDGVDGWLARRSGMASPYGAALDADLDTLAIAVLALLVWRLGDAGAWVLAAPLLRPAFVVAARAVPALARPLPPSERRRAICAILIGTLAFCLTPALQQPWSGLAAGTALALLLFSFAADTVSLLTVPGASHFGPGSAAGPTEASELDQ